MSPKTIYTNQAPLKLIFISTLFCGLILISICIKLYLDELFIGIWTFALPLLSLALIRIGLSESKVKTIDLDETNRLLLIKKESIFKSKIHQLNIDEITVELKSPNGGKFQLFPKFYLTIKHKEKKIVELKSNFLAWNLEKLKKIHSDLQAFKNSTKSNLIPPLAFP